MPRWLLPRRLTLLRWLLPRWLMLLRYCRAGYCRAD